MRPAKFNAAAAAKDHPIIELREHFLNAEGGSVEALDINMGLAIKRSDRWHNHAIFLYHAAKNAMVREVYGTNTEAARSTLIKHIRPWVKKAVSFKKGLETWIIPQTLAAFKIMGVRPPAQYVAFCEETMDRMLSKTPAHELIDLFGVSADLGIYFGDSFMKKACERIAFLAPDVRARDLYTLAHVMAQFDATIYARTDIRSKELHDSFSRIFSNSKVQEKLKEAQSSQPRQKLADAMFWFSRTAYPQIIREGERRSGLEFLVMEKFRDAGAHPEKSRMIKETQHRIDLRFSFNGCNFDVEVDGPDHFVRSTDGQVLTLNGSSVFQTMLMKLKHPSLRLIRLPYCVYDAYVSNPEAWKRICTEITEAPHGVYIVGMDGHLKTNLLEQLRLDGKSPAGLANTAIGKAKAQGTDLPVKAVS